MENEHIQLRKTVEADLESLFTIQLDQEAIFLAAFTPKDPGDRDAFFKKFSKLIDDPSIHMKTIWLGGSIIGSLAKFEVEGDAEITYWIDRIHWGKGIATNALRSFLRLETTRPIFARAAFDNLGSQKVLEKSGFAKIGHDRGFANARQCIIEEFIYRLD